jgi:signal transduction histidine kinase
MNESAVKVLLIEDSPSDAVLLEESLNNGNHGRFEITHVERLADGLERLRNAKFDVLLLDLSLPDSSGRDTFLYARAEAPQLPIIVMTGDADEAVGLDALRQGIQDYLIKGQAFGRQTSRSIRYAIERKQLEMALQRERDQLELRVRERTAELSEANQVMQSEITRRQEAEDARKQVLRRLNVAEETERGRISRELHDRLGQDLTAMKLGLAWLRKQCPLTSNGQPPPPAVSQRKEPGPISQDLPAAQARDFAALKSEIQKLQAQCPFASNVQNGVTKLDQLTDGLMRDIHRLAWELHPRVLDDLGLVAALRRYAAEWSANSGVSLDFHSDGLEAERLPLELEAALYRAAQEALTNVLRHAKAQRVSLLLERRAEQVSLIVEDDGVGFDTDAVLQRSTTPEKLGLLGMQERIRLAGGTTDIESTSNAGTTVFVRLALPAAISQAKR